MELVDLLSDLLVFWPAADLQFSRAARFHAH